MTIPAYFRKHSLNHGFSLVELLIVLAIIASLAALFITSFPGAQRRARDTKRRSDLKQFSALLRDYAINHKGYYPGANGAGIEMRCTGICVGVYLCPTLGLTAANCPLDQYNNRPKCFNNLACTYLYQGNTCSDGSACANSFVLRARLEGEAGWLFYCSNGSTGIVSETTNWGSLAGSCPI